MAMIAAIRRMLLMIQGKRITPEGLASLSKTYDFRIALAALLVHAGNINGSFVDAAKDQVRNLLIEQLSISPLDASELMVLVNCRNLQWDDVEELVLALSDALEPQGRAQLIEWLWEIVIADRDVTPEEMDLISTVANMLGIHQKTQDSIAAGYANSVPFKAAPPRETQTRKPGEPLPQPAPTDPRHPH